jgi:hypothetical protein
MRWTIYNKCPGTQTVRIAYKGPSNPFRSCSVPEVAQIQPFAVPVGATDVTCTLNPDPCTHFGFDVNLFPTRLPASCLTASGQIEIDPW